MKSKFFTLNHILKKINFIKLINRQNIEIIGISDLSSSKKKNIVFFANITYKNLLKTTNASIIITKPVYQKLVPKRKTLILCKNPELEFIKIANLFYPDSYYTKISNSFIDPNEIRNKFNKIKYGSNLYLENDVKIGSNVFLGNNVTIKKNCTIGNNVIIGSNVVLENSVVSNNVHIGDGCVIGKKGFGFKFLNKKCLRIPHVGNVIIGKDCEVGANCVIDRGSLRDTILGDRTFLDNLVHIAHNVVIGSDCIFAAQVGVAGSTRFGNNVVIGGQAGISGHLKVGNNVNIGGKSGVIKNIQDNQTVMGYPAKPLREFLKKN